MHLQIHNIARSLCTQPFLSIRRSLLCIYDCWHWSHCRYSQFRITVCRMRLCSTVWYAFAVRANFRTENCAVAVLAQTSLEPVFIIIMSILLVIWRNDRPIRSLSSDPRFGLANHVARTSHVTRACAHLSWHSQGLLLWFLMVIGRFQEREEISQFAKGFGNIWCWNCINVVVDMSRNC